MKPCKLEKPSRISRRMQGLPPEIDEIGNLESYTSPSSHSTTLQIEGQFTKPKVDLEEVVTTSELVTPPSTHNPFNLPPLEQLVPFSQPEVIESFEQNGVDRQIENVHLDFESIHRSICRAVVALHIGLVSPMGEPHTSISTLTSNFQTPPINPERSVVPPKFDFPWMHRSYSSLVSHFEPSSSMPIGQTRMVT